jgi:hypothetical protein
MIFLTIVFINVLLPVLAEPIARIRQADGEHQEKSIQYNEITSSKLRILLLGDLLKPKFVVCIREGWSGKLQTVLSGTLGILYTSFLWNLGIL